MLISSICYFSELESKKLIEKCYDSMGRYC